MSHSSRPSRIPRRMLKVLVKGVAGAIGLLLPVTALAACGPADGPCKSNCVTNYSVTPGGTSASVFAWTNTATKAEVTIYDAAQVKQAYAVDNAYKTFHILNTLNTLAPGTTYSYSLHITDTTGADTFRTSTFTTKKRQLKVSIEAIQVDNDGDNIGSGEENVYARAGTTVADPWLYNGQDANSGDVLHPNRTITQLNPAASAPINVEMEDSDCTYCTYGLGGDWTTGSSDQRDWVTATKWVDTTTPTNGPQPFVMSGSGPAGITVWGHYEVGYV
jgi:hypothetical protein